MTLTLAHVTTVVTTYDIRLTSTSMNTKKMFNWLGGLQAQSNQYALENSENVEQTRANGHTIYNTSILTSEMWINK